MAFSRDTDEARAVGELNMVAVVGSRGVDSVERIEGSRADRLQCRLAEAREGRELVENPT